MKLLAYADVQATETGGRCYHDPTESLQTWRVRKFFTDLSKIYSHYGCDGLLDLGDTTDDRTAIPIITIDTILAGLDLFPRSPNNIKLIGNHEQTLKSTHVHVGRLFSQHFRVVPVRDVIHLGGRPVICVSYHYDDNDTEQWLVKETRRNHNSLVLGHLQVKGCHMNSGTAIGGLSKEAFSKTALGLLGHVHAPQSVLPHVHYVGSPFQQDFSEANETKRVAIVDLDSMSVTWVALDGFPTYHTISLSEFLKAPAQDESENRFNVVLEKVDELETLMAHPRFYMVNEIIHGFKGEDQKKESNVAIGITPRQLMAEYLIKVPATTRGIELPTDELIDLGLEIASGTT